MSINSNKCAHATLLLFIFAWANSFFLNKIENYYLTRDSVSFITHSTPTLTHSTPTLTHSTPTLTHSTPALIRSTPILTTQTRS